MSEFDSYVADAVKLFKEDTISPLQQTLMGGTIKGVTELGTDKKTVVIETSKGKIQLASQSPITLSITEATDAIIVEMAAAEAVALFDTGEIVDHEARLKLKKYIKNLGPLQASELSVSIYRLLGNDKGREFYAWLKK